MMINLVCIGHAKCGTTLLDSVFRHSRLIATPKEAKEIAYFLPSRFLSDCADRRYLNKFAAVGNEQEFVGTFEASPQYSQQPPKVLSDTLKNMVDTLDSPNLIVCFRQPVSRAYSHYIHDLHRFALYGEGVFSRRPALARRPFLKSFEESLPRLVRSYATTLRLAYEAVGRERVSLFFLERDAAALDSWISQNINAEVADDLAVTIAQTGTVFARRPIPNYVAEGNSVHAFGSGPGEYIKYSNMQESTIQEIMESKRQWTLSLEPDEAARLTRMYFQADIEQCAQLAEEDFFLKYLGPSDIRETAEIAPTCLLRDLHGIAV